MAAFKRKRKTVDGRTVEDPCYTIKFVHAGQTIQVASKTDDKKLAEKLERKLRNELAANKINLATLRCRADSAPTTLGEVLTIYETAARTEGVKEQTRRANINALLNIIRRGLDLADAPRERLESLKTSALTGDLVYKFKQAMLAQAETETDGDDLDIERTRRTANSLLTQARSIFHGELRAIYKRNYHLILPDTIIDFLNEPGFSGTQKNEYDAPSDAIVAATFASLENQIRLQDPNLYLAVWLALGYGLRASDITQATRYWFITRDGIPYMRGDCLDKGGRIPDIRAQLGAWDRIAPLISNHAPDQFVLDGHETERKTNVFRRCSTWMHTLGWQTQKAIHEFRAYSGSKVAEQFGIRAAQLHLRHKSFATTERFYLRYITSKTGEATLTLPEVSPGVGFTPQILVTN